MEKMKNFFLVILVTGCFYCAFGDHAIKTISCEAYEREDEQEKHTCSIRLSPLCASNNVTYPNSCVFCFANISYPKLCCFTS
ncbi:ovomucoid-like isoform X2 [Octodon degus]|uniref:Ovomucoid-like isoform X2 n=1 Tax=Octodon degus TaxID=10160 RepID=A0A6P6EGH6_OCTDE|nr:ovomucoid-like isoform X2 [Octodon degus]